MGNSARPCRTYIVGDNDPDGEADDKIFGAMKGDTVFSSWSDITDCPKAVIDRPKHYFLTYKNAPNGGGVTCEITDVYGEEEAYKVILTE